MSGVKAQRQVVKLPVTQATENIFLQCERVEHLEGNGNTFRSQSPTFEKKSSKS